MRSIVSLFILLCVAATTAAQTPGPTQQELLDNQSNAVSLIETRRKLDQLIWGPEVLAQQYETRIVALWDSLLQAEDKFSALTEFAFNTLGIPKHVSSEPLQHQIARYQFADGLGQQWSFENWVKFIQSAAKDGYVLEQSEWHHSAFTPPSGGKNAISEVNFEMHIARAEPAHRVVIKGVLNIDWMVSLAADVDVQANSIEVTKLTILEREQAPIFQEVFNVVGSDQTPLIHPLLVYDLDQDGLSEIVVGGQNVVIRNEGNGEFVAERLFPKKRALYDGGVIGDFSGDGVPDMVLVDSNGYPLLFQGDERGQFNTAPIKMAETHLSLPKTFTAGDIDGDGDLDVHIANYKFAYRQGQMPSPYFDANDGYPAVMLRNDGNGKFTDITKKSGLGDKRFRRSYSSSFVDLDEDQDLDLIVVSDYAGFDLYKNDGKGNFKDITDDFGLDRHFFGMGHTFGDFDQNGLLDFYVIGMSSTTARRLERMGVGRDDLAQHTSMREAMGYGNRMFLQTEQGFEKASFNDQVA
ncbi:MAG: VCBS repeat-containing protein, partial [Pseudomonadota bacterium]